MSKATRKPFMIRIRDSEREPIEELAVQEDISEAEVVRRLLLPAVQLAKRYGLHSIATELRRHTEDLSTTSTTLRKHTAKVRGKLPLKTTPQTPSLHFGG